MSDQAFISWSGHAAKEKAAALKRLIKDVLPEANVFMSDHDIPVGSLWLDTITSALDRSIAGVVIVTADNVDSPWLHFEAGALSNRVERRMVIPLLSGVEITAISATPLSAFQAVPLNKDNICKICESFASALGIVREGGAIGRAFGKFWSDYENDLLKESTGTKKTKAGLDDIEAGIVQLQAYARAQADILADILKRSDTASSIQGQGPFATMTPDQAYRYMRNMDRHSSTSISPREDTQPLQYKGGGSEEKFISSMITKFETSRGRIDIIKRLVGKIGVDRLRNMTDEDIRMTWRNILYAPEFYGIVSGAITGLAAVAPEFGTVDIEPYSGRFLISGPVS